MTYRVESISRPGTAVIDCAVVAVGSQGGSEALLSLEIANRAAEPEESESEGEDEEAGGSAAEGTSAGVPEDFEFDSLG